MNRPVLVTGGTGFLGQRVVHALGARGVRMRLLCRGTPPAGLVRDGDEVASGDVRDAAAVQRAAAGCGAILHLAARVSRGGARADFDAVNVDGLRHVLAAAASSGSVERVIVTSSLFALGPSDRLGVRASGLNEAALDLPCDAIDHYQASKREGALLARAAARRGEPVITLFPGVLVGPGPLTQANLVTAMIRDHLSGHLVPVPDGGRHAWSFVHVDDVAEAHALALESDSPGDALVLGGENRTLRDLFDILSRLTGRRSPWLSVPRPLLWSAGLAEEALERTFGRAPRRLTRGVARMLCHAWSLDSGGAQERLGWRARSLESTLADTVTWLRAAGHVPGAGDGERAASGRVAS